MITPSLHPNESHRLESLKYLNILDTAPEKNFDEITKLASSLFDCPISLISLVDENRQWFKSNRGLKQNETSREISFCAHAILQENVFVVEEASRDVRFFDNPLVLHDPQIKFYAGAPLKSPNGFPIGTLCVIDVKGKKATTEQLVALQMLSNQVTQLLELKTQINRLKIAESEKIILQAQVAESARLSALGEMAGGVAHEINNPLAIIKGKAELIKRKIQTPPIDKAILMKEILSIENTVDRISKIIQGLRNYSRNAEKDAFKLVSSKSIIDDTLILCTEKFKMSLVEVRLKKILDIQFECRAAQISQILMNLLSNSFDAIQELKEKWIEIEMLDENDFIVFRVRDSGSGIDSNVEKKMMDPFFTTKEVGKGTGLGLSISSKIANSHGGSLKYLPTEKKTTFELKLKKYHLLNA